MSNGADPLIGSDVSIIFQDKNDFLPQALYLIKVLCSVFRAKNKNQEMFSNNLCSTVVLLLYIVN